VGVNLDVGVSELDRWCLCYASMVLIWRGSSVRDSRQGDVDRSETRGVAIWPIG